MEYFFCTGLILDLALTGKVLHILLETLLADVEMSLLSLLEDE